MQKRLYLPRVGGGLMDMIPWFLYPGKRWYSFPGGAEGDGGGGSPVKGVSAMLGHHVPSALVNQP